MPAVCAARATITSSIAVPAVTRSTSTFTSLKPRPNLITTPGTPPSRTIATKPVGMYTSSPVMSFTSIRPSILDAGISG